MALCRGSAAPLIVLLCLTSFTSCSECQWFTQPKGVINTPNFPKSYSVPLRSCYVIKRERHTKEKQTKTILYFTQFFLNEIFVESYKHFTGIDSPQNSVRVSRKVISAPTRPTSLIIPQLYTVIQVDVKSLTGGNLRVPENLMDVYGFNITYEIIDVNERTRLDDDPNVSEPCMKHQCSYNGMCRANANLTSYYCDCFKGFRGRACQYSSRCNEQVTDRCKHATRCEHFMGLTTLLCFCKPGYTGKECDRRYEPNQCAEQKCPTDKMHFCSTTNDRNARCECEAGNKLLGCHCESGWKLSADRKCVRDTVEYLLWQFESSSNQTNLQTIEDELSRMNNVINVTSTVRSSGLLRSYLIAVSRNRTAEVETLLMERYSAKNISREEFVILSIVSNKPMPVQEGNTPVVLSCDYRSAVDTEVRWYKDGALIDPGYGPGNLWIEHSERSQPKIFSSYLGLDHVQYIDRGVFTCEILWKGGKLRRSFTMSIKMQPSGVLTPTAQNVEYGRSTELWCGLRVYYEDLQYRWYKNIVRDDSNQRKHWVPVIFKSLNEEYVEPLHPSRSRLVIPAVRSYAEYKCSVETATFSTEMFAFVFPYANTSKFCPAEEHLGVTWNRTVVGSFDVQSCMFSNPPKGEARRLCVQEPDGSVHWAVPDFFDCAFQAIYEIRKEILGLVRGYQMTTAVNSLEKVANYLSARNEDLLPGEGNHIIETLHEILEYDDGLPKDHPEIENRKSAVRLFLDCVSMTFNISNAVSDDRFYAKLNDMIPQIVIRYLSNQPAGTEFVYKNNLFEIRAEVFKQFVPSEGFVALYKATLPDRRDVSGRVYRNRNNYDGDKLILSLLVFRSLEKEYLSRLEWIQRKDSLSLLTKLVNFKAATAFDSDDQRLIYHSQEKTVVNFKLTPPPNTSIHCARIVDGSEVNFAGSEVTEIDGEFSCETRGSSIFALYGEPLKTLPELEVAKTPILRSICAIIGLVVSFVCVLSVSCTTSSWGLIKCVKLNVCVALFALFTTALFEALSILSKIYSPKVKMLRQFYILVCQAQQLLVLLMLFIDPERGCIQARLNIYLCLCITWLGPAFLLLIAFGLQRFANTDSYSYWGTLENIVTVPDAQFTALIIVGSAIYGLILTEVGISTSEPSESQPATVQKGIMKRSLVVTISLFFYGIATTGYVQDTSGDLQAITSVLMALIVFIVYTAYCETDVFYRVVWAYYKKNHTVKSLSHRCS